MKKIILSIIAVTFSAQVALADDLDSLHDVQEAIGSAIGAATADAVHTSANIISEANTGLEFLALTPAQLAALTPAQIAALTPAQLAALTPTQIAALSTAQVAALSLAQLAALTPAQFAAFTTAQLAAISPTLLAALGVTTATTAGNTSTTTSGTVQTAALGIQASALTTTPSTSTPSGAANINAFFAANPTAAGEPSVASEAATSAALTLADTEDYNYEDE